MATNSDWLQERIDRTKALIVEYENALEALACGAQSYRISTGQTDQMVTKAQLANVELTLQRLENRLAVLCARAGQQGRFYVVPGF
jgi:hypothetical protein